MPRKDSMVNTTSAQAQQDSASMGIDAFELPKSVVTKLARAALPENAKMQKEMLLAVLKGSTVFVNYLAVNAHEVASSRQHKSVSASDVLRALEQIEMGDIVPKLQAELEVYRANQKADKHKKGNAKTRSKETDSVSASVGAKGKGKEKATGPTITIPRRPAASSSASAPLTKGSENELDDDTEMGDKLSGKSEDNEDEEMMDAELDEDEPEPDEDEPDNEDDDEEEEIVDAMAIEEEELKKDARGVEEREHVHDA